MRILLCSNYQPPHMGGIEFAAEALKACWETDGHEVTWVTTDLPRGARSSTPDNIRIPAWNGFEHAFQINSPVPFPGTGSTLARLIDRHDAVNPHSLAPGLASRLMRMASRRGKRVVATQHVGIIPLRFAWLSLLQENVLLRNARYLLRRGGTLTFVGEAVRAWFADRLGLPPDTFPMTPAGINQQDFYFVPEEERSELRTKWNLAEDTLNVLFVGRFYEKKGLPLLQELAAACPDIQFTLVGSGPINPAQWNLRNVRLISYVETEELRELYGAHDLFIMPSVGEGWPAVIPQAMACGLPCLLSEETFTGFNRDRDMFLVRHRTQKEMTQTLELAKRRKLILPMKRDRVARYASEQWDWKITAFRYLTLCSTNNIVSKASF